MNAELSFQPILSRLVSDAAADECPVIPMGAVTGRPSRQRLHDILAQYASAGITQFLVYPRSGCELEYLSDEWFDTVEALVEEAKTLGFTSIWLYDEFNWPSGQAAGKVMAAREDFKLQTLQVTRLADGTVRTSIESNPRFPNLLNPEAVQLFIQLTHEAYAQRLGTHFGSLIKGIFTDEPSPGYVGEYHDADTAVQVSVAWWPTLEEEYEAATGRGLREDIVVRLEGGQDVYSQTYHALMGRRFRAVFFDQVREWCDQHQLLLTGHLMGENGSQARRFSGDPLLVTDGFSLPGVDEIPTKVTVDSIEWQTLSGCRHAIELRGNGGLAELYALGPSDMPLARFRQMMWVMAAFGIDHYLQAVSQLDARGNASKSLWYNPLTPTQTWFPHYREFGADARAAARMARSAVGPEVCVRYLEDSGRLPALLRAFVERQRPWRMLNLGEAVPAGAPAVLDARDEHGLVEELTGQTFPQVEAFLEWLQQTSPRQATILEADDDTLASDVFVRCYADGSVLVIDLRDGHGEAGSMMRERTLRLRVPGYPDATFILEHRGVEVLSATSDAPMQPPAEQEQFVPAQRWQVTLERDNLFCPEFAGEPGTNDLGFNCLRLTGDEPAYAFKVNAPLTNVRAVIRRYAGQPCVLLDGQELAIAGECRCLPDGLRQLYGESAPFSLTPGTHELRLRQGVADYWYLPCVFLAGTMAVGGTETAVTLSAMPVDVPQGDLADLYLRNYVGKVTLSRRLQVPARAFALRLGVNGMVTDVRLAGVSLGTRCWAPFVWTLPEDVRGREAELEVTLEVPVGAMFGRARMQTLKNFSLGSRRPGEFGFCGVYGLSFELVR